MKKRILFALTVITLGILAFGAICASAETSGIYTYSVSNGEATITACKTSASGAIVIPDELGGYPVRCIGDEAFYNCYSLTSVTIGNSVTSIGDYAFEYCISLTSVTIGNSVTSIGNYAFSDCTGLTQINWNAKNVADFEEDSYVFASAGQNGSGIQVTFGANVKKIPAYAFYNCGSLTSVTIGNSVTSIGDYAFRSCIRLTQISWNAENVADFKSGSDVFANTGQSGSGIRVIFGDSVKKIPAYAFYDCERLTSVTIGNSVTSIGDAAFSGCTGLESVYITDLVSYINCEYESYDSNPMCYAENLYLDGELVTKITIPDSVTSIGSYVFYKFIGLTSITIPDSVTSIGDGAFYGCTGLESVYITDLAAYISCEYESYDSNPMYYAENLYLNGKLVTKITIPNGVTSIGSYVFYKFIGLTSITIPDSVTSIGDGAFYGCTGLESVCIGNSVTSIGSSAFYNCTGLTSVTMGNSVTSIGSSAFSGCICLTSIEIPNSVTSIGDGAFYGCIDLTLINWNAKNVADFADDSNVLEYAGQRSSGIRVIFGDGVERIPAYLFYVYYLYEPPKITSVTIGNSVTSIGDYAFKYCSGLTSITIPDSVTSIGRAAFDDCTGLKSVTIGNGVTSIGGRAFRYCTGLTSITIPDSVTSIGDGAFWGCTRLTSIVIPNGVTSIDIDAFCDCTGLTSVTIGNGVTSIGDYAFKYCSGLTSITIPDSVTSIGEDAFCDCTGLTSVTIGNGVTSIGIEAFYNCTGLTSVTIGNGVTNIGSGAFNNCTGLTQINWNAKKVADSVYPSNVFANAGQDADGIRVVFGDGTERIPEKLFAVDAIFREPNITSVIMGDSVTSIGKDAFSDCAGLTSIVIPSSVTSIGGSAFWGCTRLKNVYYTGSEEEWKKISIGSGNTYLTGATRHYNQKVKPIISKNNQTYTVSFANNALGNSAIGKSVIVALYNNEKFVEMASAVYDGTALVFTTTQPYTIAKIMVWGSLGDMQPVCKVVVTN